MPGTYSPEMPLIHKIIAVSGMLANSMAQVHALPPKLYVQNRATLLPHPARMHPQGAPTLIPPHARPLPLHPAIQPSASSNGHPIHRQVPPPENPPQQQLPRTRPAERIQPRQQTRPMHQLEALHAERHATRHPPSPVPHSTPASSRPPADKPSPPKCTEPPYFTIPAGMPSGTSRHTSPATITPAAPCRHRCRLPLEPSRKPRPPFPAFDPLDMNDIIKPGSKESPAPAGLFSWTFAALSKSRPKSNQPKTLRTKYRGGGTMQADTEFMRQALALARETVALASPNPAGRPAS